ncbi:mitochondrial inner membrane protease ATP23 homolog [Styela clava]
MDGFLNKSGEARRNVLQTLFFSKNGKTKEELEHDTVKEIVEKAFKNEKSNPYFSIMMDAMGDIGCFVDVDTNIAVKQCGEELEEMLGAFNYEKNEIEICQDSFSKASFASQTRAMQTTLSNILVSAFDHCRANLNYKEPEMDMCSSIRAAALSGQCSSETLQMGSRKVASSKRGYQSCVIRNAVQSFLSRHPDYDLNAVQPLVKKVFLTCFYDHSPHDRLPYDEKQAELSYKAYIHRNRYSI